MSHQILILCDKPASAQIIATALSAAAGEDSGELTQRKQGDLAVHEFYAYCDLVKEVAKFKVTSAVGNLLNTQFEAPTEDVADETKLFAMALTKKANKQRIVKHVVAESVDCSFVLCAFENDRKGECKAFEVVEVLVGTLRPEQVLRCRVPALTDKLIRDAFARPTLPHPGMAAAWEMVQGVNIRVGQSFLKYLTRVFSKRYLNCDADSVCYGVGITPTLALCVTHGGGGGNTPQAPTGGGGIKTLALHDTESKQKWILATLPGKTTVEQLYAKLTSAKGIQATVVSVKTAVQEIQQETGLNVVALMELASRELGFGPGHSVQLAENLYLSGYITYPRTQATQYPSSFNLATLPIQPSAAMKRKAVAETADGQIPITPLTRDASELDGDRLLLFHAILSQYTSACSIRVTTLTLLVEGGATFTCQGMAVAGVLPLSLKRTMPKMPQSSVLPTQRSLTISRVALEDVVSVKKTISKYTEGDLIADMGRLGIGADGSMGPYINTICERKFVTLCPKTRVLQVTNLGQALYNGFCDVDAQLVDTDLRAQIEAASALVESGALSKDAGQARFVAFFLEKFVKVNRNVERLMARLDATFDPHTAAQLSKKHPNERALLWTAGSVGSYLGILCTENLTSTETVAVYDKIGSAIKVYGAPTGKTTTTTHWDMLLQKHETEFLAAQTHVTFANSFGEAKLSPGMTLQGIRPFSHDLIVSVRVLFNSPEMREGFFRDKQLTGATMSWWNYDRSKMQLKVAFLAKKFVANFQVAVLDDPQVQYLGETIGRRLQFLSELSLDEIEGQMLDDHLVVASSKRMFQQRTRIDKICGNVVPEGMMTMCEDLGFENYEFFLTRHHTKAEEPVVASTDVCFNSLPRGSMRSLQGLTRNGRLPTGVQISQEKGSARYIFDFFTAGEAQKALQLFSKDPRMRDVCMTCDVQLHMGPQPGQAPHPAVVPSELRDVFPTPYLDDLSSRVLSLFRTKVTLLFSPRGRVLRLEGGSVIEAHHAIKADVECIRFEFQGDAIKEEIARQWMAGECAELAAATSEGLVNIHFTLTEVLVFGTPSARGDVMLALAGQFERMSKVTRTFPIAPALHLHFMSDAGRQALTAWATDGSRVAFMPTDKTVRIVGANSDATMAIEQKFATYMTGLTAGKGIPSQIGLCWCGQESEKRFSSCGHAYCRACLDKTLALKKFPLRCGHPDHPKEMIGGSLRGDSALISVCDLQEELMPEDFELLIRDAIAGQHNGTGGCVQFCLFRKTDNCPGIVLHGNFMACHACSTPMCTRCKTTDKAHDKKTCEEFQRILTQRKEDKKRKEEAEVRLQRRNLAAELETGTLMEEILTEIRRRANHFVVNWPRVWVERRKTKDKRVHGKDEFINVVHGREFQPMKLTVNDCWTHPRPDECPIRLRFQAAVRQTLLRGGDPLKGFFAWHGTGSAEAVEAICHEGWDVRRRWGQVFGPGEYFGVTPDVSHGYARGCGKMILCYIIDSSIVKHVPGFCYVVKNPAYEQHCLPVSVVSYNHDYTAISGAKKHTTQAHHIPLSEPPHFHVRRPLRAPLHLACRIFEYSEGRAFFPYTIGESRYLEERFSAMKKGDAEAKNVTMYVCRWVDWRTMEYKIDLGTMTQVNVKTKYKRAIRRVDATSRMMDVGSWFVLESTTDVWISVGEKTSVDLDTLYRDYCLDRGHPVIKIALLTAAGDRTMYEVDFLQSLCRKVGATAEVPPREICRGVQPKKK